MERQFLDFLSSLVLGLGFVFLASPFMLLWIYGDYERYVSIISAPYPDDNFGGGPFQHFMYLGLFLIGLVLIGVAVGLRVA